MIKTHTTFVAVLLSLLAWHGTAAAAEPLKIGYSDWPGYTLLEVAKQKGWFKEAGVDVDLVWFDYLASIDAYLGGQDRRRLHCGDRCPGRRARRGPRANSSRCWISARAAT